MTGFAPTPVAIVGVSAIMPDAPDAAAFWANLTAGRYSIGDVPPERWDPDLYYDPDPRAPDKTYSRIGGWVRSYDWDPIAWKLPVPPRVSAQLEDGQKWAVAAARAALLDAGWPQWTVDPERVAVVIGNAIGGEKHYRTNLRVEYAELVSALRAGRSFAALPDPVRAAVLAETRAAFLTGLPEVTEDTMPGELANIIAGRVASLFNFRGPNFTTDAACASGLAATTAAVRGLQAGDYDAAVTGGVDRNMGAAAFVKFCKIGALSATGTRPFDAGADGFVMGEGAALFVLKRLADAERAGDRIYAVLLGLGGSSDGRGKGITAPNPVGQRLAVQRAWSTAGVDPARATYVEAHGTSTRVGDATELASLTEVFGKAGAAPGSVALGSVKSNIGHLKGAAGAAGLFKTVLSLHEKMLVPSLHFAEPNPNVDWATTPFRVTTELAEWPAPNGQPRCAGVSAFGFGGTNFHAVVEEYVPGRHRPPDTSRSYAGVEIAAVRPQPAPASVAEREPKAPPMGGVVGMGMAPRGAAVVGGRDEAEVLAWLERVRAEAIAGRVPPPAAPDRTLATAAVRVAIDHADAAELAGKAERAIGALRGGSPAAWRMLRAQGVHIGRGTPGKVAFLYPGQGSQYVNMLAALRQREPVVRDTFAEADEIMTPLLGQPLTSYIFAEDPDAARRLEARLMQTEITQPAVLAADLALTRLLGECGMRPDLVMGHSLGEYAALVAAGSLTFSAALEAVSARGREMANLSVADNGAMAAVFGPLDEIERVVSGIDGYVVIANINSTRQAVIGGATAAVERAIAAFQQRDITATRIPVSHAFHTAIVAPASDPLQVALRRLDLRAPALPVVANVTGEFYPPGADVDTMLDLLGRQVAAPVRFVAGLRVLYDAGARVFVEVGPKKALHGFVCDVLCAGHDGVVALFTNHPKVGEIASFNQALCGLYAAGVGYLPAPEPTTAPLAVTPTPAPVTAPPTPAPVTAAPTPAPVAAASERTAMSELASESSGSEHTPAGAPRGTRGGHGGTDQYAELGRLFANVIDQGLRIRATGTAPAPVADETPATATAEPVVVTGAALGLPGVERVFDDENLARILDGQQFIDAVPHRLRRAMVDRRITRLVKRERGDPTFETIGTEAEVVKLAGRGAPLDVVTEFGVAADRDAALDRSTRLAIGAGFDALRDAGIPLVLRHRTTTLGTSLPDRWCLPEPMRDDTGVIFASAFPGYDAFAENLERYHADRSRREQLAALEAVRARLRGDEAAVPEVDRRIRELRHLIESEPYAFDRRFLFRCLSMGHSQFAEIIGARGPNTQVNAACASTTQALCLAEDWIRAGRCRRVVVVSADDATSDTLLPWLASGFLASGAAATDDVVADAAIPFDRRRHGMVVGMGAAAFVVESAAAARERGIQPICEVLGAITANSAYHGTRLDVDHIGQVMERAVRQAESYGCDRREVAPATVFVSHETYTPARGGSAQAEINALRRVFGAGADAVVIANTKGLTGHAMGAGVEDVVAIKSLETGLVPPVPNVKEPDPELGPLNLSTGGAYPVRYALRLAAGFGSQIAVALLRWTPVPDGRHRSPHELGYEYRIVDPAAWQRWLGTASGRADIRLEVTQRRLRIADPAAPAHPAAPAPAAAAMSVAAVSVVPAAQPESLAPAAIPLPATTSTAAEESGMAAPAADAEATEAIVEIVSGLTGYPPDLLDPDLDLEADLGIDTVKQAEVFAAVRERFGVARDDNLRLRDFPTLTHVIGWIRAKTALGEAGGQKGKAATPPTSEPQPATTVADRIATTRMAGPVAGDLAATDRVPRRVPVPALRPELAACKPTGATLDAGTRVVVMLDEGGVGDALAGRLHRRGVDVLRLDPGTAGDDLLARLGDYAAAGPVHGIYWLPALDDEGPLDSLDLAGWREALRRRVGALYATARRLYDQDLFLVTGTRLGGYHGYDAAGATCPLGGAVTGFAKAYRRERPDSLVKAVDFAASRKTAALAELLVEETLRDPGCVEVGYAGGQRFGVGLLERPFGEVWSRTSRFSGDEVAALGPETVLLVTGAAGSIVSAITADLAAATGGTFHLLDLTPAPEPADPDLRRYAEDRDGLAMELAARMRERGDRPTPVAIERELAGLERRQAALAAIQAIERAGGRVHYHAVDLTDAAAVEKVMAEVRGTSGRVDVLLHAAGLEISHGLPDKQPAEFDLVFGVKADGLFNVLRAAGDLPIGTLIAFSSVAGRFGNAGQTDYAAANDLLCKLVSGARRTRPGTRGLAIDWTAWGGIGMATRGSIPKVMAAAGVEVLPPEAGVAWIRRELTSGSWSGEVLVAGALGQLAAEYDPTGGLDPAAWPAAGGPMVGEVVTASVHDGLIVRTTLDPARQPFLDHHRIDGVPVLPGVMGIEAFAEIGRLLAPQSLPDRLPRSPDWRVASVENVEFRTPVKFHRDQPRTLTITALAHPDGDDLVAECALAAEQTLPGSASPQRTVHFTGSVRLSRQPVGEHDQRDPVPESTGVSAKDVYRLYFHGPAYQVVGAAWRHDGAAAARLATDLPPAHQPPQAPTVLDPRVLELCFQAAGLWEAGTAGRLALPRYVGRVLPLADPAPGARLVALARPVDGGFDCTVVDGRGATVLRMADYRTVPLAEDLPADVHAAIRAGMTG
jgi:acyl transferase domain-containing protein